MSALTLRERIKLNALVAQFSDVCDPTFTIALFERVMESSGSAESAFAAVRESGYRPVERTRRCDERRLKFLLYS